MLDYTGAQSCFCLLRNTGKDISCMQFVQNSVASILTGTKKQNHISQILVSLDLVDNCLKNVFLKFSNSFENHVMSSCAQHTGITAALLHILEI